MILLKKILFTGTVVLTCIALVSCGNNDNTDSSVDNEIYITEYTTNPEYTTTEDRYYDDEHYETDDDGNVDPKGSSATVEDHVHDAVDGVENAGESIIDGVGDAASEIIDGAGDAVDDVADGLDGETTTETTSEE